MRSRVSATTRQMALGAEQIQGVAESLSQLAERLEELTTHSRVADGRPTVGRSLVPA